MFKLCFYVPKSHLDIIKEAVFAAGAGRIGDYEYCCWQALGEGQFRPLAGSSPHIGELNKLTTVAEYRVELVCQDKFIGAVIDALQAAHPYEEPAFDVIKLEDIDS